MNYEKISKRQERKKVPKWLQTKKIRKEVVKKQETEESIDSSQDDSPERSFEAYIDEIRDILD